MTNVSTLSNQHLIKKIEVKNVVNLDTIITKPVQNKSKFEQPFNMSDSESQRLFNPHVSPDISLTPNNGLQQDKPNKPGKNNILKNESNAGNKTGGLVLKIKMNKVGGLVHMPPPAVDNVEDTAIQKYNSCSSMDSPAQTPASSEIITASKENKKRCKSEKGV